MAETVVGPRPADTESVGEVVEYSAVYSPHRPLRKPSGTILGSVENLQNAGRDMSHHLMSISQDWARKSRQFVLQLKRDQPMHLLGMIAGGAFALGLILGFKRSGKHE